MITQEDIDAMGDGMGLVDRLRGNAEIDELEGCNPKVVALEREAADRIESLEERVERMEIETDALNSVIESERALADRLAHELDETWPYAKDPDCLDAYRKARGL